MTDASAKARPDFIRNAREMKTRDVVWPGSDEVLSIRAALSRPLGLVRLGVHHETLRPGHRSSLPHAEVVEEECVYVLEGRPDAWIDGILHPLAPDDIVVFPPGTGIRHTIVNRSEADVRLLVIGERAAVGRERVQRFQEWLGERHPEIEEPAELAPDALLALADEFEEGRLSRHRGLRESWQVGLLDHLYPRHSDFEDE